MNDRAAIAVTEADVITTRSITLLSVMGERIQHLRNQRGMTRKDLARASSISERHLANMERGTGNSSVLILQQVATGLNCSIAEILFDAASSPEEMLIKSLLAGRGEDELRRAVAVLKQHFGVANRDASRATRISLIGLRGAGKSTLGQILAGTLDVPFIELSKEVERHAGLSVSEIHSLYGVNAYRRYERRALDEVVQLFSDAVIATPGGVVADASTFNQLLQFCTTVWIQASPEEHMNRVLAQGDTRPMAQNQEAMEDLRRILSSRATAYARADMLLDTSGKTLEESSRALLALFPSNSDK